MSTRSVALLADLDLVARAQAGDPGAMDELLATLRPAIVRFCQFRLSSYAGGRDAADDAAQETCLAVANVLDHFENKGAPFRAWVYAIAANKVADTQRRFSRSPVLVDELPEQVEPSPTPEDHVVASAEYGAAMILLETLPARVRHVVLLRASGFTAKSVGEVVGMTAGAVDVTHHRAITRLRELADETEELRELLGPYRHATGPALPRVA